MYSFGNHGKWPIQVSGKLSTLEKQVSHALELLLDLSELLTVSLLCSVTLSLRRAQFPFRFGEGYIITVRIQGDLPNLEPLYQFFSDKFPRATLKVRLSLMFVLKLSDLYTFLLKMTCKRGLVQVPRSHVAYI